MSMAPCTRVAIECYGSMDLLLRDSGVAPRLALWPGCA